MMSQKKRTTTKTAKVFLDKIQNSVYATGMVQIPLFILKNVGSIEVLSPEQEKQITEKIAKENCEESKNKLFNSNLKLALKISREKTFQDSYAEDVFNEACIGLWEAVSKYDASKGFRFSTYAAFLMRSKIYDFVCVKAKMIRMDHKTLSRLKKIKEFVNNFYDEHGTEPTAVKITKSLDIRLESVEVLLNHIGPISSLDKNFESSNDFYYSFSQHQEEDFHLSDLQQQIKKSFSELTEKEQLVVSKRFGLDGGDELIYSQIGRMLNLTKQRIEQINKSALDKVRKSFINNGVKSLEYI